MAEESGKVASVTADQIIVTKDVDAYLKANPPPAPAARAVTLLELCDPRLAQPLVSSTVLSSRTP